MEVKKEDATLGFFIIGNLELRLFLLMFDELNLLADLCIYYWCSQDHCLASCLLPLLEIILQILRIYFLLEMKEWGNNFELGRIEVQLWQRL